MEPSHEHASHQPDRQPDTHSPASGVAAANPVLHLQQTIGNRAVGRMVQARLRVSQPEDPDERSADLAADEVMRMLDAGPPQRVAAAGPPAVQRRAKRSAVRSAVQRKVNGEQPGPPAPAVAEPSASPALIVEDDHANRSPGQMTKSEFLATTRQAVCEAAEGVLSAGGQTTARCPYLGLIFVFLERRDASYLERTLRSMAPGLSRATTATAYVPFIVDRVRQSTRHWMRTGEVTGVPEGIPTSFFLAGSAVRPMTEAGPAMPPAPQPTVPARSEPGGQEVDDEPEAIQAELGAGRPIESAVASRMGAAFGSDFSNVRVHDDSTAARVSDRLNATAFTLGDHVAFSTGAYRPGTVVGDALLAHELAHTVQQGAARVDPAAADRGGEAAALEEDADRSAVGTVARLWAGASGTMTGIVQNVGPSLRAGLQLQRCETVKAPADLEGAAAKSAWIKKTMKEDRFGASAAIIKVFKSAQTMKEIIDIQKQLDMPELIDYLDLWDAVQLGTLGPVVAGADKLNARRKDYIVKASLEYGPYAEVFVHLVFNTMHTDDMKAVLTLLAKDKRLAQTVLRMGAVKAILKDRDVKLSDYEDVDESLRYALRGVGQALDDLMATAPASGRGATPFHESLDLPEEYNKLFLAVNDAVFKEMISPKRVVLGTLDYAAFHIPSGVYGLASGLAHGTLDIARGKYEQAAYELTGASLVLLSYLGVKAYRAVTGPKTVVGPAGPGQFVIKGFTGPIKPEVAKLGAILQLNGEAQAAAGLLFSEIGQAGVLRVAKLVQADSKAALLVYERGLPAIRALHKEGSVARAAASLPPEPAGLLAEPWAEGLSRHGYLPDRIFMDWEGAAIPSEGWKLHVSADAASAAGVADAVLPKLRSMNVTHKVVQNEASMARMTGTQEGKFITIYPESVAQARAVVEALDSALTGKNLSGPVIAGEGATGSSGLIYRRYGAFNKDTVTNPAGVEVPDAFRGSIKPPWVVDPWAEGAGTRPVTPAAGSGGTQHE